MIPCSAWEDIIQMQHTKKIISLKKYVHKHSCDALPLKNCAFSIWFYPSMMIHGIIDLVMAIICIMFINEETIAVLIYVIGIIYSAVLKITIAFRRTKFVYFR